MRPKKKLPSAPPNIRKLAPARKLSFPNSAKDQQQVTSENFFQMGRRSFITSMIAILMIPVSTAIGYYMNKALQRPELNIAVIDDTQYTKEQTLQESAYDTIVSDKRLLAVLRDTITKLETDDRSCADWLSDRNEWHSRCMALVDQTITGLLDSNRAEQSSILTNLEILEKWSPGESLSLEPMQGTNVQLISATALRDKAAAVGMVHGPLDFLKVAEAKLVKFSATLDDLKTQDAPLTGKVDFHVGVLNNGDSDGVVFNTGKLRFAIGDLWIYADTYTVVKAHSFEKITFHIGKEEQDPVVLAEWEKSVRSEHRLSGKILLKTDNEKYFQASLP